MKSFHKGSWKKVKSPRFVMKSYQFFHIENCWTEFLAGFLPVGRGERIKEKIQPKTQDSLMKQHSFLIIYTRKEAGIFGQPP